MPLKSQISSYRLTLRHAVWYTKRQRNYSVGMHVQIWHSRGDEAVVIDANKSATAPYISFRTFLNLLDRLHGGGIPQHIDRHFWGGFLAGGVGQQVMAALRFLGLIDPVTNEPTPMLERLVAPEQRKAAMAELLRERYSAVWDSGIDPARTTPDHLDAAFSKLYKVDGETRRKAVTFFVHAAKFAELPLSMQVAAKTRQRQAPSTSSGRPRPNNGRSVDPPPSQRTSSGRQPPRQDVAHKRDGSRYGILHDLLDRLPEDQRWTAAHRMRWLRALEANLDLLVETTEEEEYGDSYEEEYEDSYEEDETN